MRRASSRRRDSPGCWGQNHGEPDWGLGGGNACLKLTQIRRCSPLCLVAEGTGRCSLNLSVSTFSGNDLTDSQSLLRTETRTLSHTPPQCQMQFYTNLAFPSGGLRVSRPFCVRFFPASASGCQALASQVASVLASRSQQFLFFFSIFVTMLRYFSSSKNKTGFTSIFHSNDF